ncbi:MAG: 50S ribosomal protein L3 [Deltaproteobacteria bacterium]|nr:50S ribosomal protein L3 [Deltaproteobacteria bacterium]
MLKGLLGKKLGMTGIFAEDGRHVPVTVIQVGPCVVTQIKTKATDGYDAIQVGFLEAKKQRVNKPAAGHFAKSGGKLFRVLKEFGVLDPSAFNLGQVLTADIFAVGEKVDIAGKIKGRGFQGSVKRHGFAGGPDSHGCMHHRRPGSIGASAWPSRVVKGKRLPGHYGDTRQTTRNLVIVDVRPEQNLILVKGAVPGSGSSFVEVRKPKSAFW